MRCLGEREGRRSSEGKLFVPDTKKGIMWCDASSMALGVILEIEGVKVEDAAWLRKKDCNYINVTKLDAVLKGVNLVLRWGL